MTIDDAVTQCGATPYVHSSGRKRVYVVSSLHYVLDEEENRRERTEDVLEVRLQLIEALATTIRRGSYFSDGFYKHLSDSLNSILETTQLSRIRNFNKKSYEEGGEGFAMYDMGKVVELFKRLRKRNCMFRFKPTEKEEDINKIIKLDVIDRKIIENVAIWGTRDNILFVGLAHALETLPQSGLDWYRLNVVYIEDVNEIHVGGTIPKRFQQSIGRLAQQTKSGIVITNLVDYV